MDEDLLRGRAVAKKASKKTPPELSLPYVPGGKHSNLLPSPHTLVRSIITKAPRKRVTDHNYQWLLRCMSFGKAQTKVFGGCHSLHYTYAASPYILYEKSS